jgi:hypothetical protein
LKSIILFITYVFICTIPVYAQQAPISTFILTALDDGDLKDQKKNIAYLEGSSANMPIIDDIEARVRNRAFEFDKQRYTLRVEPRGFGETRASTKYYKTTVKHQKQKKDVLVNELLTDRYNYIIELLNRQTLYNMNNGLITVYEDRIKVLQKQMENMECDLNDIIKAEDKLTQLKFENIERKRRINRMKEKIGKEIKDNSFTGFDTSGFVDIEGINKEVNTTAFTVDKNNVYLEYDRLDFQRAKSRYDLENAEGRRYLSYLEFSYDHGERFDELERKKEGKEYDLNRTYLMELGIRIPYINVDRHDIHRRKLSYLRAKEDYKAMRRRLERRTEKDVEDIKLLVSQYNFLTARRDDVKAESSLKKYLEMDGVDPLILLSIRESIIENDIELEKIKFDIFRNYIRLLDASGKISEKPLRNYLSMNKAVMAK